MPRAQLVVLLLTVTFLSADSGKILRILDANTLWIKSAEKTFAYRFSYVLAPNVSKLANERYLRQCPNVTSRMFREAAGRSKRFVASMIKTGKSYQFEIPDHSERYKNRCVIFVDKKLFNEMMVEQGYAVPHWEDINEPLKRYYSRMVKKARSEKKGLWKTHPAVMRCLNSY